MLSLRNIWREADVPLAERWGSTR